jgi:putative ABC transport system substrate-binding protein
MPRAISFGTLRRRHTGQIPKGEKPADMPVLQPTVFEFGHQSQDSQSSRLAVPPTLTSRLDEIIE